MIIHRPSHLHFLKSSSSQLIFITLIISIGLGMFDTILSLYLLYLFGSDSVVGLMSGVLTFVVFVSFLILTQMYSKYPITKVWLYSTLFIFLGLILLYFSSTILLAMLILIVVHVALALQMNATPILLVNSVSLETIGKTEGVYYTFKNLGWVIGPLLAGYILFKTSIVTNFLWISLFVFLGWVLFIYFEIKAFEENKKPEITISHVNQNIRLFFSKKQNLFVYFLRGGLSFYWAFIYVFVPLYMIKTLPMYFVGIYLFMLGIPVILTEIQVGKLIDKVNVKYLFIYGFLIMSLSLIIAYFINNIYFALGFVIFSVMGASLVEPTVEAYFFKITDKMDAEKNYGIYRTSDSLFSLFCRLAGGILFIFFSVKSMFLFAGILLFLGFLLSRKI